MNIRALAFCLPLCLLTACATVPKEAVELSVTLGRDLTEVHRAHRELAVKYFDRTKSDINNFIDQVYKPYTIQKAIHDFNLVEKTKTTTNPEDLEMTMDVFVTGVVNEVESLRRQFLAPIEQRENDLLSAIDESYQTLQNANSILTGHLASIRKVTDAQAEFLKKTKLEGLRQKFTDSAATLSERISEITTKGQQAKEMAGQAEKTLSDLKELLIGDNQKPAQ